LLSVPWFLAGAGAILTLAAIAWARHVSRRLERLAQSYWELRYEYGQLNARVGRLEPPEATTAPEEPEAPGRPKTSFVPLSSLRK
jgi:hypothetical protein